MSDRIALGGFWSQGGCLVPGWVPGPRGVRSGGCLVDDPPDSYCCGRYTSYWNAFLSSIISLSGISSSVCLLFSALVPDVRFGMKSMELGLVLLKLHLTHIFHISDVMFLPLILYKMRSKCHDYQDFFTCRNFV